MAKHVDMVAGKRTKGKRAQTAALDPPFREMRASRAMFFLTPHAPIRAFMLGGTMTAAMVVSASAGAQTPPAPGEQDTQEQVANQIRTDAKAERESRTSNVWPILGFDVPSAVAMDAAFVLAASNGGTANGKNPGNATAAGLLVIPGGFAYTLGAPIIHWIDGGGWQGAVSFGLHLAGLVGGIGAEAGLLGTNSSAASVVAPIAGALVFAIPTVIDLLFLPDKHLKHEWPARTAWAPTVQVRQGGGVVGLGTAF